MHSVSTDEPSFVVRFLLGNSLASEFYMPTFRNTLFHLHRQVGVKNDLPMKTEQKECSETSAYKIHMPENYPEESIQHSEHGESLKLRTFFCFTLYFAVNIILKSHFDSIFNMKWGLG